MKISFEPSRAQLKVFSAICSDFVVVWIIALFGTQDFVVLTFNIVAAILFWYLATKADELSEKE